MSVCAFATMFVASCTDRKTGQKELSATESELSIEADTTVYGKVGEATGMSTFELITGKGDTLRYILQDVEPTVVKGGMMPGDKLAVTAGKNVNGEDIANNVINLTTLLGKWISLDKSFEIRENGEVKSFVREESNSWTKWKVFNGKLLLNRDTFDVYSLGADSLMLENKNGIFAFKRKLE